MSNPKEPQLQAYRKEALKWHPGALYPSRVFSFTRTSSSSPTPTFPYVLATDKNPDNKDAAERRFKEISQAFKILSNADERAHFDRFGDDPVQRSRGPRSAGYGGTPQSAEELSPEDIFNMFFGINPGARGGGHMPRQRYHRADGNVVNVNFMQVSCKSWTVSVP